MNNIDTICLSSGGINSFSFLGALRYLINYNYIDMNKIHTFIGCSGGAILVYLLAMNYEINNIINFITNNNLNFIKDININNLFYDYGFDKGKKIMYLITFFLKKKFNKDDITFIELYNLTNNNLIIIGTKIVNKNTKEILFNKDNTPNMSVLTAIRITIAIPIIYTPVYYENNYYIDGGIINKFPYNYCDPNKTIGLCINNINYINPLHILFYTLSKPTPTDKYEYKYIIFIDIINKSDFDISKEYINYLIYHGEETCKNKIKSNFSNSLFDKTLYYNNIYYLIIIVLSLFFILKFLWNKS
jgi:predicted acylesterase/phospholipase RssA